MRESIGQRAIGPRSGLVVIFVSMVVACGPAGERASTPRVVEDPAMTVASAPREVLDAPAPETATAPDPASVEPKKPAEPHLDASGENIFIPGMGWMPTPGFMEIYDSEPGKLPPDLDLIVIHEIREALRNRG